MHTASLYSDNIELKLDNIKKLCNHFNNPQKLLKFIHIAGTNGKGSVCAFLESIFFDAGLKVGKFSSPELINTCDSISVNRENISEQKLLSLFKKVEASGIIASDFEILTMSAFLYFLDEKCDIVILETGLGGTGDATNIISSPEISVITRISCDHTNFLGNTLEEIAQKKAGIIKSNSKTITIKQDENILPIIENKCLLENNTLTIVDTPEVLGNEFISEKIKYKNNEYTLSLGGIHQAENAVLAIETAIQFGIPENHINSGVSKALHPARFELMCENPTVIFDGAHNADGFLALLNSLDKYFSGKKKSLIIGMMKDKDILAVVKLIKDRDFDIYTVTVPENPRAISALELKNIFSEHGILATDIKIDNIKSIISNDKINVICGSLYLYKSVRPLF